MNFNALRSIRTQLEEAIEAGVVKTGLRQFANQPKIRREILESIISDLETDVEKSFSNTEKMWLRLFISEAKLMHNEFANP